LYHKTLSRLTCVYSGLKGGVPPGGGADGNPFANFASAGGGPHSSGQSFFSFGGPGAGGARGFTASDPNDIFASFFQGMGGMPSAGGRGTRGTGAFPGFNVSLSFNLIFCKFRLMSRSSVWVDVRHGELIYLERKLSPAYMSMSM